MNELYKQYFKSIYGREPSGTSDMMKVKDMELNPTKYGINKGVLPNATIEAKSMVEPTVFERHQAKQLDRAKQDDFIAGKANPNAIKGINQSNIDLALIGGGVTSRGVKMLQNLLPKPTSLLGKGLATVGKEAIEEVGSMVNPIQGLIPNKFNKVVFVSPGLGKSYLRKQNPDLYIDDDGLIEQNGINPLSDVFNPEIKGYNMNTELWDYDKLLIKAKELDEDEFEKLVGLPNWFVESAKDNPKALKRIESALMNLNSNSKSYDQLDIINNPDIDFPIDFQQIIKGKQDAKDWVNSNEFIRRAKIGQNMDIGEAINLQTHRLNRLNDSKLEIRDDSIYKPVDFAGYGGLGKVSMGIKGAGFGPRSVSFHEHLHETAGQNASDFKGIDFLPIDKLKAGTNHSYLLQHPEQHVRGVKAVKWLLDNKIIKEGETITKGHLDKLTEAIFSDNTDPDLRGFFFSIEDDRSKSNTLKFLNQVYSTVPVGLGLAYSQSQKKQKGGTLNSNEFIRSFDNGKITYKPNPNRSKVYNPDYDLAFLLPAKGLVNSLITKMPNSSLGKAIYYGTEILDPTSGLGGVNAVRNGIKSIKQVNK